jgi:KDO2-lipid IV(A) lauroyltransferase
MTGQQTEHPLLENPPPHTFRSRLSDAVEFGMFYLLQLMPIDLASDIGSALARRNIRQNLPHVIENGRANLKRLRPDWDDATIEQALYTFQDNVGRLMAEFAVLHRLAKADRIETDPEPGERMANMREAPTLMLVMHTGNWEVFSALYQANGVPFMTFAIKPDTWAQRVIATQVRTRLGATILPPDRRGLHRAKAALMEGEPVAVFCDEARDGVSMAPLFGRAPHRKGNLAIASWLARQTGCRMTVMNCRRLDKSRFKMHATEFFHLPESEARGKERELADVTFLNEKIEPIVRENLDQWYFLDDKIEEI